MKTIRSVMLIDDNESDNFFHERVIRRYDPGITVIAWESGQEALDYLRARQEQREAPPDLIFLDINMPGMNGWEFIEAYQTLDPALQGQMIVVMLTTSDNPDDKALARMNGIIADFRTKPLTPEMLEEVLGKAG
jgi:CheY-like chemotaxis protein